MPKFTFTQTIQQLEKRKGGYFYVKIDAEVVEKFEKKRHTRLLCTLDEKLSFSCGLNHLGDGNYYIIIASKYLKSSGLSLGDPVKFVIEEDPNPLGVEIPEALLALLEQDPQAKKTFQQITDGKKRSLIYSIQKMKDLDKLIQTSITFLEKEEVKLSKKRKGA